MVVNLHRRLLRIEEAEEHVEEREGDAQARRRERGAARQRGERRRERLGQLGAVAAERVRRPVLQVVVHRAPRVAQQLGHFFPPLAKKKWRGLDARAAARADVRAGLSGRVDPPENGVKNALDQLIGPHPS